MELYLKKILITILLLTVVAQIFWILYIFQSLGYQVTVNLIKYGTGLSWVNFLRPTIFSFSLTILLFAILSLIRILPGSIFFDWFLDLVKDRQKDVNSELRQLKKNNSIKNFEK